MRAVAFGHTVPLVVATSLLLTLVVIAHPSLGNLWVYGPVAGALTGAAPASEFAQDYVGARALLSNSEMYPVLGDAFAEIGLDWPIPHRSTHPPSAFLLAIPLAPLPWRIAEPIWILLMLLSLAAVFWSFHLNCRVVVGLTVASLLWTPIPWSLFQLSLIWALGIAVAWRCRSRHYLAGAAIGLASLPKFLAAIGIVPFILRRDWRAVAGFAAVWSVTLAALLVLRPNFVLAYLGDKDTTLEQLARPDNGALLISAWRLSGPFGPVAVVIFSVVGALLAIRRGDADAPAWAFWTWLGVALLPIAWNYSLVPLLPWLGRTVWKGGSAVPRLLATAALVAGCAPPAPGAEPIWGVPVCMVLAGCAFALELVQRPVPIANHSVSVSAGRPGALLSTVSEI